MSRTDGVAVIVPACDEVETIGGVLDALAAQGFADVLVVDDGSRDGTGAAAAARGARVIRHEERRGYGAALKSGLAATGARHIAIVDADGTYDAADLARVVASCPEGGMAIGARAGDPSRGRAWLKACARRWVRWSAGVSVPDLNSGLRAFDRRLAQRLADQLPDRFSFTTTMTLGALALGAPVAHVPVSYAPRRGSASKFSALDALRFARTAARGARWVREGRPGAPAKGTWRWAAAALALLVGLTLVPPERLSGLALPVLVGLLAYVPFVAAKVVRWRLLLAAAGVELPPREAFEAYVAGLALGAVTPGRAGELVRIAGPARSGHPIAALAATTAVDRLFDLGAVALAAGLGGLAIGGAPAWAVAASGIAGALFGALFILAPLASSVSKRFARARGVSPAPRTASAGERSPAGPARLADDRVGLGVAQAVAASMRPRVLLAAAGWTAVSMSAFFAVATMLLHAAGVSAPPLAQLAAVAAGNLAALVPVTIGGLGSRESAVITVLSLAGHAASPSSAALYAVAFHAVFTLSPWVLLAVGLSARTSPARAEDAP